MDYSCAFLILTAIVGSCTRLIGIGSSSLLLVVSVVVDVYSVFCSCCWHTTKWRINTKIRGMTVQICCFSWYSIKFSFICNFFFSVLQTETFMRILCSPTSSTPAPSSSGKLHSLIFKCLEYRFLPVKIYSVLIVTSWCLPGSFPPVHTLTPADVSAVYVLGIPPSHRYTSSK